MNISTKHFRTKPTFYKNFESFVHFYKQDSRFRNSRHIEWPCLTCYGNKEIWDPNDPLCPIEGNKMRSRIKCQCCNGTGESSLLEWKKLYNNEHKKYQKGLDNYQKELKIYRGILRKLTPKQLVYLRNNGFKY